MKEKMRNLKLFYCALGGPLAWLGHLLGAYVLAEFGCLSILKNWNFLGLDGVIWALIVLSLSMMSLAYAATWLSYKMSLHVFYSKDQTLAPDKQATMAYLVRFGVVGGRLFILIIVFESVPIFYFMPGCFR